MAAVILPIVLRRSALWYIQIKFSSSTVKCIIPHTSNSFFLVLAAAFFGLVACLLSASCLRIDGRGLRILTSRRSSLLIMVSDNYSYSSDYEVIGKLKQFADRHGVCILIVHHTRKQPAGDSFEKISGTTGLSGCADGALIMQKEKRTDGKATLEISGRDQPDQRLYLSKDQERLVWLLDHAENELWKQPPDPVLEAVAKIVSDENREWEGSPTELAEALRLDMAVNRLIKHLNVNASRLLEEHQVKYENKTKHAGRRIRLTYMVVEAPAFEVIE